MPNRQSMTARVLAAAGTVLLAAAAPLLAATGWNSSYTRAMAEAKKTGKPVLANFTSTSSCPYCVKLRDEVFRTRTFVQWAKENVILLDMDSSRSVPPALERQRTALYQRYGIQGVPTVLFLDYRGNIIGRSGYMPGGAERWTTNAKRIIQRAPKPEKLEPLSRFTEAQAAAKEQKLPLMVLAWSSKSKAAEARFKMLLDDPDFAAFVKGRMVVVRVDTSNPGEPTPEAAEDRKALEAALAKVRLRPLLMQTVVLDAAGEKSLYSTTTAVPTKYLIPRLLKALPKPAYNGAWIDDYSKASKVAHGLWRPMLLHFSGSDWSVWCKRLEKNIFATGPFRSFARQRLVLVKVDLPRQKKLPAEIAKQNQELAQKYRIKGLPTLLVLDPAGNEKARRSGYPRGGARELLAWLNTVTK